MRHRLLAAAMTISSLLVIAPAASATSSWAHPQSVGPIRAFPNTRASTVARVHLDTEDGYPEVYPILATFRDTAGRGWARIAIPMRPNGRTGWIRDTLLGPTNTTIQELTVDRRALRATLRNGTRVVWTAPIGVGTIATPTPAGSFWIREKLRVTFGSAYGPRAFGTSDYSVLADWPGGGVIGIHGTDQPGLIPGRPSHGCIRLRNADVLRLFGLLDVGTPMRVT